MATQEFSSNSLNKESDRGQKSPYISLRYIKRYLEVIVEEKERSRLWLLSLPVASVTLRKEPDGI
jgi:hypothetical protein